MLEKGKVLIIDDDPDILDVLDLTFSTSGFQTNVSTEGEDVHQMIEQFSPDAIVLDMMLSGIDGRNICRTLKADDETKHIPIVMISANHDGARSSMEAGADEFIAKPFDIDVLVEKVENLLN